MSPDKQKKLNILRKNLDKLDDRLILIIKKRTEIVKKVLKLKNPVMQLLHLLVFHR